MPAAWRAEPQCRDSALLSATKQADGAASSLRSGTRPRTVYSPGEQAAEATTAWLPSMKPVGPN